MSDWKNKLKLVIIAALLVAAIYVWQPLVGAQSDKLEVNFFDIGQGDAALIEEPGNVQVLIDGGPSSAVLAKLGSAMPKGDKEIELVIITHPDKDHIAGLVDVFKRYKVQAVLATMVPHPLGEYEEIKRLIQEKQIPVILAQAPQKIMLAKGSYLEILYPFDIANANPKDTNGTSIVAKLVYGQQEFLFTGDLESEQETELVFKNVDVQADVLKVGHHGSKTSTTERFLAAANPAIAVISAGKNNRYGHPTAEVIERLQAIGAQIFRTDQQGDIVIQSNGITLEIAPK